MPTFFIAVIYICALSTHACDASRSIKTVELPQHFSNKISLGLAGPPCMRAAMSYITKNADRTKFTYSADCVPK